MSHLIDLSGFNYKTYVPIRFGDLNAFGVVNNDVFLTYFEIAHSGYRKHITRWESKTFGIVVGKAEINYLRPVRFNDELFAYVRTSRIGNCSFDVEYILTIKNNTEEEICTTGKTICIFFDYNRNKPAAIPQLLKDKMIAFEALAV